MLLESGLAIARAIGATSPIVRMARRIPEVPRLVHFMPKAKRKSSHLVNSLCLFEAKSGATIDKMHVVYLLIFCRIVEAEGIEMNKVIQAVLVLAAVAVLFLLATSVTGSMTEFRTRDQTDEYAVNTGTGITSANVTLTKALWGGDTSFAEASSDNATDVPRVTTYLAATKVLTIEGLAASTNRTLTIVYSIGALDANTDRAAGLSPLIWFAAIMVLPIIAVVVALSRR